MKFDELSGKEMFQWLKSLFKIRNAIMNYIEEINKICKVEKAILFGSYVSGHYSSMSDIDIAIFSKEINNNNRIEFIKKFFMKINKYRLDIQPIAFGLNDLMDEENAISLLLR